MNATVASKPAVRVSGNAHRDYSALMRRWSGWKDKCTLIFGPTDESISPYAMTEMNSGRITVNVDNLVLNPNRVINTVTPFRLRQEGILTGAMLHEAGHARHSHWMPMTEEGVSTWVHGDGEKVTKAQFALARLMDEPRVEALIAEESGRIGATNLAWTMRAMAHAILPPTELSSDPDQMIMDVIQSWALRAGREMALFRRLPSHSLRNWVGDFNMLLNGAITDHLTAQGNAQPDADASKIVDYLIAMALVDGSAENYANKRHYGFIATARQVLEMLFPNTPPEEMPAAGGGCAVEHEPGEDEGSGGSEPGEGEDEGEGEADDDGVGAAMAAALGAALAEQELTAKVETRKESSQESKKPSPSTGAGTGGTMLPPGFRLPTPAERDMKRNAERFLRDLVDPSEASKTLLTEAPSATVDPAEMAAWKAGGQVRDPRFFRRVQRQAQPTPPVRIAVLVDVSSSMDPMQKPSALLSWAVAAAAFDLRNFAGRGAQIESCLIHWGTSINTIQARGQMLPGIYTTPCRQGTDAMDLALDEVAVQMPGFFDVSAKPVNRLLIQFTDWEVWNTHKPAPWIKGALESGVNMLSVVPHDFSHGRGALQEIMQGVSSSAPGVSTIMKYDSKNPEAVWSRAAQMLREGR